MTAGIFNPAHQLRRRRNIPPGPTNRDARLADPTVGFLPLHRRTRHGIRYLCAKCGGVCDGPSMFCQTHLAIELRP